MPSSDSPLISRFIDKLLHDKQLSLKIEISKAAGCDAYEVRVTSRRGGISSRETSRRERCILGALWPSLVVAEELRQELTARGDWSGPPEWWEAKQ